MGLRFIQMTCFSFPLICIGVVLLTPATSPAAPAKRATAAITDTSRDLAAEAIRKNPSIVAIRQRLSALSYRVRRAGAWLDPKIAVDYSNMPVDRWIPGGHPMSGIQFKLQQTFLFPGKTTLRKREAKGYLRQTKHRLAEAKVQLSAAVRRAYYMLALVRQLRGVTRQHVKLVEQFSDVVKAKYVVGKAGQHDLIRLSVLLGRLRDDLKDFERDDRSLVAKINATLHRPGSITVATPAKLVAAAPPRSIKALLAKTTVSRPELRRYDEVARTHRIGAQRASREGYPNITAWLGYRIRVAAGNDPGTNFVGMGVAVPLPIFYSRRHGSEKLARRAMARAAESKRSALLDRIRGALSGAVAAWKRAASKALAYRKKLMPLAHRALDATFAAYQVDRADFASLFQAEIQLLRFERAIFRATAATHVRRVEVEALVGTPIR